MDQGLEVRVALLESRLETVDRTLEEVPKLYVTKPEMELALNSVTPSKDLIKEAMQEVLTAQVSNEKQAKRNWLLDMFKIAVGALGTGGVIALIQALQHTTP